MTTVSGKIMGSFYFSYVFIHSLINTYFYNQIKTIREVENLYTHTHTHTLPLRCFKDVFQVLGKGV